MKPVAFTSVDAVKLFQRYPQGDHERLIFPQAIGAYRMPLYSEDTVNALMAERDSARSSLEEAREAITGRMLYEAFWTRNGGDFPAWKDQAEAIIGMWNNIAADARRAAGQHDDGEHG